MVSCRQRDEVRAQTLDSWRRSDWGEVEVAVEMDQSARPEPWQRIDQTWLRLLDRAVRSEADFHLLLEDDIEFNRYLRHNLERWTPFRLAAEGARPLLGSLYRCCQPVLWQSRPQRYLVAMPEAFWGGQALVLSRATARHLLSRWVEGGRPHDVKIPRLASQIGPVYFHAPSLVQHRTVPSTWGNTCHQARDYDPLYRVP
jgi:hypothetical protein